MNGTELTTVVAGLLILVGLAGVVVPVLPGLLLVWLGVGVWALDRQDTLGWTVLAVVTLVLALGSVVKYLLPGRRLRDDGVPWLTLFLGAVLGVVGFFVLPVIGLPVGFVLGIYLAELFRMGEAGPAWASTKRALVAVGWSMLIELAAGLVAGAVWLGAVVLG